MQYIRIHPVNIECPKCINLQRGTDLLILKKWREREIHTDRQTDREINIINLSMLSKHQTFMIMKAALSSLRSF